MSAYNRIWAQLQLAEALCNGTVSRLACPCGPQRRQTQRNRGFCWSSHLQAVLAPCNILAHPLQEMAA